MHTCLPSSISDAVHGWRTRALPTLRTASAFAQVLAFALHTEARLQHCTPHAVTWFVGEATPPSCATHSFDEALRGLHGGNQCSSWFTPKCGEAPTRFLGGKPMAPLVYPLNFRKPHAVCGGETNGPHFKEQKVNFLFECAHRFPPPHKPRGASTHLGCKPMGALVSPHKPRGASTYLGGKPIGALVSPLQTT